MMPDWQFTLSFWYFLSNDMKNLSITNLLPIKHAHQNGLKEINESLFYE